MLASTHLPNGDHGQMSFKRICLTFGFGHEHDDKDPQDDAPCRVPAKRTLARERAPQTGISECEDEIEAPRRCCCP